MIKKFCKLLVYKDFKPTLLSKILYEEVLSRNINVRMCLSRVCILSVLRALQKFHTDEQ
jgi:hypothetical protein